MLRKACSRLFLARNLLNEKNLQICQVITTKIFKEWWH